MNTNVNNGHAGKLTFRKLVDRIVVFWVLLWVLDYLVSRPIGVVFLLTILYGTGIAIVVGTFLNVLADSAIVGEGWFFAVSFGVGAVAAAIQVAKADVPKITQSSDHDLDEI